jgi:hypothetical protein
MKEKASRKDRNFTEAKVDDLVKSQKYLLPLEGGR